MLAYYTSASNFIVLRTQQIVNPNAVTMSLENMYTLDNTTGSVLTPQYNPYESLLYFTASIASASIGDEYRATIIDTASGSIWNGSIQVYQSQSIDKPVYKNQIPLEGIYISNVTDNEYIILD
jgi:hypothetical protein